MTATFSPSSPSGAQRLAEPALVVGDQVRGGGEDVGGRAVVALQPDDLGAGKVVLEAQDVVDLGAAPAIDRLVVVADAADVLERALTPRMPRRADARALARARSDEVASTGLALERVPASSELRRAAPRLEGRGRRSRRVALRQQPQPQILRDVGVLVLVDQDVLEAALIVGAARPAARGTGGWSRSRRSPKSAALSTFSRA